MRRFVWMSFVLILAPFSVSQTQTQLNLMPMPASVQTGSGELAITQTFSVAATGNHDASVDRGIRDFMVQLSRRTGIPFRPKALAAAATLEVQPIAHARRCSNWAKMSPTN